jgi:hypothetical protein
MRNELKIQNLGNKFLTSILHTHCKKTPAEHFEALKLVQNLKLEEKNKNP